MRLISKLKVDKMPCETINRTFFVDLNGCEVDEVLDVKCYDKRGLFIPHETIGYNTIITIRNRWLQIVFPDASWIEDITDINLSFKSKVHQRRLKLEEIGI